MGLENAAAGRVEDTAEGPARFGTRVFISCVHSVARISTALATTDRTRHICFYLLALFRSLGSRALCC